MYREPHRRESDDDGGDGEQNDDGDPSALRGADGSREAIDDGLVLVVIHAVHDRGTARRESGFVREKFHDAFVLGRVFRFDSERGTEWIVAKLVERLKRELIVRVPRAKRRECLVARGKSNALNLWQLGDALPKRMHSTVGRRRHEVDVHVHLVSYGIERKGECCGKEDEETDDDERHRHNKHGRERHGAAAREVLRAGGEHPSKQHEAGIRGHTGHVGRHGLSYRDPS